MYDHIYIYHIYMYMYMYIHVYTCIHEKATFMTLQELEKRMELRQRYIVMHI